MSYRSAWRASVRSAQPSPRAAGYPRSSAVSHTRRTGIKDLDAQRPEKYKKVCPKNSDTPRE